MREITSWLPSSFALSPRRDGLGQLALGALGAHGSPLDLDLHSLRDVDGLSADP